MMAALFADERNHRARHSGLSLRGYLLVLLPLILSTFPGRSAFAEATDSSQVTEDTLRVLTYNLHGLLEDGANPGWDSLRTAWLIDAVERLNPDIVGFQEVLQRIDSDGSDNQIKTLADSLTRRTGIKWEYRSAVAHPSWERFDEGVAILSRHPIRSSQEYRLEARDVFQRNALKAHVRTPLGEIVFLTTHLAHRGEAEAVRAAQVAEIKRHFAERSGDGAPVILVGDFNAEPDRSSIGVATGSDPTGRLIDAFSMVHPGADGFTFPAHAPSRRIDYVFVTESSGLIPVRAKTVFDESMRGVLLSDHLGVLVEFTASPTPD